MLVMWYILTALWHPSAEGEQRTHYGHEGIREQRTHYGHEGIREFQSLSKEVLRHQLKLGLQQTGMKHLADLAFVEFVI